MQQMVLDVRRKDSASFDNFYVASNQSVVDYLHDLLNQSLNSRSMADAGRVVYLWGWPGSGKSHLLSAAGGQVSQRGAAWQFWQPGDILVDLPFLICVDDVEHLADQVNAERELLSLYERVKKEGGLLLIAGEHPPSSKRLRLPDLVSRLNSAPIFEVSPLTDIQKREALQSRADKRGFNLSSEVVSWLLAHASRDMRYLLQLLDQVDIATLVEQRKVSVPLIKQLIAKQGVPK